MIKNSYIYRAISIIFLIVFIPVLFLIYFFGNNMEYHLACKNTTLYSNGIILIFVMAFILIAFLGFYLFKNIKMDKKLSMIVTGVLGLLFVGFYFVNLEICKCIWLEQQWDIGCVVGGALKLSLGEPLSEQYNGSYFSLYPNNVPITYILYQIYELANSMENFTYWNEFAWIISICILISVAGFLTCITVKKVTNNLFVTFITLLLYVIFFTLSPWKTAPYTDMFGILAPVCCLCLYVYSCYAKNKVLKYILWFFSLFIGILSALIKITILIVPIAIILLDFLRDILQIKKQWKGFLLKVFFAFLLFMVYLGYKEYIYDKVGYVYDENAAVTYHHYLLMGLNEENNGSYNSDMVAFHGQFMTPEERISAQNERIVNNLTEKGFWGYIKFAYTKLVMTFNDGAFGWGREGQFTYNLYPSFGDEKLTLLLRDFFWPGYLYSGQFNTISQFVWLLIISLVPGICITKKIFISNQDKHVVAVILLAIVGVIFYQILFESRARYLLCFVPVFIVAAGIGIGQYYEVIREFIVKIREKVAHKK